MSAGLLVLVGVLLCFAGAWSARVTVLLGGFGAAWLLAELLGASASIALLVAAGGAVTAFVLTLLMAKFVLFVTGCVIGALLGARLWVILDAGDANWAVGLVFVPMAAIACGALAQHYNRAFLRWGTAFAGASLVLSGIGRLGTDVGDELWRPETTAAAAVQTVLWVALAVLGHRVQSHGSRRDAQAES